MYFPIATTGPRFDVRFVPDTSGARGRDETMESYEIAESFAGISPAHRNAARRELAQQCSSYRGWWPLAAVVCGNPEIAKQIDALAAERAALEAKAVALLLSSVEPEACK